MSEKLAARPTITKGISNPKMSEGRPFTNFSAFKSKENYSQSPILKTTKPSHLENSKHFSMSRSNLEKISIPKIKRDQEKTAKPELTKTKSKPHQNKIFDVLEHNTQRNKPSELSINHTTIKERTQPQNPLQIPEVKTSSFNLPGKETKQNRPIQIVLKDQLKPIAPTEQNKPKHETLIQKKMIKTDQVNPEKTKQSTGPERINKRKRKQYRRKLKQEIAHLQPKATYKESLQKWEEKFPAKQHKEQKLTNQKVNQEKKQLIIKKTQSDLQQALKVEKAIQKLTPQDATPEEVKKLRTNVTQKLNEAKTELKKITEPPKENPIKTSNPTFRKHELETDIQNPPHIPSEQKPEKKMQPKEQTNTEDINAMPPYDLKKKVIEYLQENNKTQIEETVKKLEQKGQTSAIELVMSTITQYRLSEIKNLQADQTPPVINQEQPKPTVNQEINPNPQMSNEDNQKQNTKKEITNQQEKRNQTNYQLTAVTDEEANQNREEIMEQQYEQKAANNEEITGQDLTLPTPEPTQTISQILKGIFDKKQLENNIPQVPDGSYKAIIDFTQNYGVIKSRKEARNLIYLATHKFPAVRISPNPTGKRVSRQDVKRVLNGQDLPIAA